MVESGRKDVLNGPGTIQLPPKSRLKSIIAMDRNCLTSAFADTLEGTGVHVIWAPYIALNDGMSHSSLPRAP
ncbi:hypothetical protein SHAM105786_07775 [Shewanella amazonensis]